MDERAQSPNGSDHDTAWHTMDPSEVAELLHTGSRGLGPSDVTERLDRYGPNVLAEEAQRSAVMLFIDQFRSPLIYILLVAAVATIALEEYIDTAAIFAVLLLNAILGFTQERKAEQSVMALRQLVAPKAHVVRDGRELEIESADLVPGDLVLFESGSRVPADVRVVQVSSLMVDESLLTGESVPVQKRAGKLDADASVADRTNMMYAGTTVTSGRGRGYVVETGDATELGSIAEEVRAHEAVQTPLQSRMDRFAKIVGAAVLLTTVVAIALGVAMGFSVSEMLLVGVGLAVATVPEGLPIVFTVALAIGVRRMAQRNVIVRRLPAVETLGSTTVIGSDKTGTLTENRMTVEVLWTADGTVTLPRERESNDTTGSSNGDLPDLDAQPGLLAALYAGSMANEAAIYESDGEMRPYGDPTEVALLVAASRAGIDPARERERHAPIAEIPFEPDLRYSASLREMDGASRLYVKGAPERVLEMADKMFKNGGVVSLDRRLVEGAADEMAGRGLRVLASAVVDFNRDRLEDGELPEPSGLTFAGLFGMMDPPREGVKESIANCQASGIRVIMITGDHAATARAIASDLGIAESADEVLTGRDLDEHSDEDLDKAIERVSVFARVSPQDKLRIVQSCRRNGHVVSVTGDGVNDAPALKAADLGIAMGRSGTDVAREASDMVLTDDNFVSIYGAVEQGRVTFDNVRKVTFFLVSTAIAAPITILAALAFGWPLPFVPAQLLWLNLVTNGLQDVALAFEPGEPDVLKRKPRPREEGIISSLLWERSVITGLVMSAGTLGLFWWELERSGSLVQAQTVALTMLVMFQMIHVGNARSDYRSAFHISPFSNPFLLAAVALALIVHVAALYFGPTQFILRVEPISLEAWVNILAAALSIVVVVEIHKLLRPRPNA